MTDSSPFRISQGYDVLQPRTGRAFPVPCDKREFLKGKLRQVSPSPWFYQTVGSLLGGAGTTTFVTILSGRLPPPPQSRAVLVAWAVVAVSIICAAMCFLFAHEQRKMQSVQVSDVVTQMELIERRYERPNAVAGQTSWQATLR